MRLSTNMRHAARTVLRKADINVDQMNDEQLLAAYLRHTERTLAEFQEWLDERIARIKKGEV